jgi:DNA-binding XRE family transcriptional regulator
MMTQDTLVNKITNKEYEIIDGYMHIPMEDYEALKLELLMLLANAEVYRYYESSKKDVRIYPGEIRQRIVEGESPVKVFRDYRKMTQGALAKKVGVSKTMISHIESGRKHGSAKTLIAIAKAMHMDVNDLVRSRDGFHHFLRS